MIRTVLDCFLLKRRLCRLIYLATLIFLQSAHAEVVRYRDADGRQHYVDSIEKVPSQYRDQLKNQKPLPEIGKITARELPKVPLRARSDRSDKIVLLVTKTCPYCIRAEEFFLKNKVRFQKYDIAVSKKGKQLYKSLGGGGVPIIKIGSEVVRGYNPKKLRALLNL